jgi:hypothetical protein
VANKQKLETIAETVARADKHADQQQFAAARDLLLHVRADCERAGIASGLLAWRLCVVFDVLKERRHPHRAGAEVVGTALIRAGARLLRESDFPMERHVY